jgi:hypothetical protein
MADSSCHRLIITYTRKDKSIVHGSQDILVILNLTHKVLYCDGFPQGLAGRQTAGNVRAPAFRNSALEAVTLRNSFVAIT